ncbi:Transketolase 2 [Planctomycetes bacterium Pan216]|uniref:Transketolase n=1 Tax=Kolteria novifilia TaxID=2527975 RepID=A0A518BC47_9BACT|nr:Transketolase 2 [Planctomycetes bacterium Pan216]
MTTETTVVALRDMATKLRIHSIESTTAAGSGHPTSCCSIAEIMSVLFFDTMRYHVQDPRNPNNDRLILSKGHAAPILYAAWAEAGLFPTDDLLRLRQLDCDLEGHPTPRLSFVDVATGSLGQGLSVGVGMALSSKYLDHSDNRVYVVLGDGESAEGSVWEALSLAGHYRLDNLCAIFDINRLGQSEATMFGHDLAVYRQRIEAFGWNAIVIDGHDITALRSAFTLAASTMGAPTALICQTYKGHGIPGIEDEDNWHGKALGDKTEDAISHLKSQLSGSGQPSPRTPLDALSSPGPVNIAIPTPDYTKGEEVATRAAYGSGIKKLGAADERVVAIDGDTKNSTYAQKFHDTNPERFFECYIAEQNLVGVGVGLACRGKIPFVSTFACFLTRAFDQIRMAAISQSTVNFVGSHAGVSIGEDGPSQMALEDLAMFRTIPNCVVFYPSDAVSGERALELAANYAEGMTFTRTSRPATPVVYDNNEPFRIGQAKILRSSPKDVATLVGAGVTLAETLKAAERLEKNGLPVRVIDPFTIKPIDAKTLITAAKETGGVIITVEDHYPQGGLGEAVASAVAAEKNVRVFRLAVGEIPRSGESAELLHRYGIDADAIVAKVEEVTASKG